MLRSDLEKYQQINEEEMMFDFIKEQKLMAQYFKWRDSKV